MADAFMEIDVSDGSSENNFNANSDCMDTDIQSSSTGEKADSSSSSSSFSSNDGKQATVLLNY